MVARACTVTIHDTTTTTNHALCYTVARLVGTQLNVMVAWCPAPFTCHGCDGYQRFIPITTRGWLPWLPIRER
jgi:hypothetical protein